MLSSSELLSPCLQSDFSQPMTKGLSLRWEIWSHLDYQVYKLMLVSLTADWPLLVVCLRTKSDTVSLTIRGAHNIRGLSGQ